MTQPLIRLSALLVLLGMLLAPGAPGTLPGQHQEAFRVDGAVEKPGEWTTARLQQELAGDIKTVTYTLRGETAQAHCVPLLTLLQAAKPRLNPKVKNHQLAFVALVRAADGYAVAFSLGELLPQYGKQQVWIAMDRNGKPLADREAPTQLLVPEDEKPSRWIHGITRITLVDGMATQKR